VQSISIEGGHTHVGPSLAPCDAENAVAVTVILCALGPFSVYRESAVAFERN
jgi:hypothetical protein